jgi:hypothetical protein
LAPTPPGGIYHWLMYIKATRCTPIGCIIVQPVLRVALALLRTCGNPTAITSAGDLVNRRVAFCDIPR